MKSVVLKLYLHVVTVFAFELDACLGAGQDCALPGTK